MLLYALWVVSGLMLLLWIVGVAGAFTMGATVHLLLLAAVVAVMATLVAPRPRVI
jgi:cellobiose-specific phosphotransferase system component IIC